MPASATRRSPGPWTPPAGPARSVPSRPITKPRQRPDMSINTPAPAGQHRTDPRPPAAGPGAARDHARRLRESGGTYRGIATAAGLAPTTVHDLVSGRRPGTSYTATALRAVTSETLPRARLDAGGTRLRLRALHVMGHGSARIARALGVRETAVSQLVRGDARTIRPR